MPKHAQFTKESIIDASIDIIRANGAGALSARTICKKLGCSVAPLFWTFSNMEELLGEVRTATQVLFMKYVADSIKYVPAFKEFGIRLIRFSREEPELFHYLFLDKASDGGFADSFVSEILKQNEPHFNLTSEQSGTIFRYIWPFACGLAVLSNKFPELYSEETISEMLSTQFQALMMLVKSGKDVENVIPVVKDNNEINQNECRHRNGIVTVM